MRTFLTGHWQDYTVCCPWRITSIVNTLSISWLATLPLRPSNHLSPFPTQPFRQPSQAWTQVARLFLILYHHPNLRDLECGTLGLFNGAFCPDADKIMEGRLSNLQRLRLRNTFRSDTRIANNIFQWLPHLKEINIRKRVLTAITKALVLRCQELELFMQRDHTEPIHLWQSLREQRISCCGSFKGAHGCGSLM